MNGLNELAEHIAEISGAEKIYLFGEKHSVSTGELKEASFCVIVPGCAKEAERMIYSELETDFPFDLLVYSSEKWKVFALDSTSYASSIMKKGTLIYGKQA